MKNLLCAAAALVLAAGTVSADALGTFENITYTGFSRNYAFVFSGSPLINLSYSYSDANLFDAAGIAVASLGTLGALATAKAVDNGVNIFDPHDIYQVSSEAEYDAVLRITPRPSLGITSGLVSLVFDVNGTINTSGPGASAIAQLGMSSSPSGYEWASLLDPGYSVIHSDRMPITFGVGTPFAVKLFSAVTLDTTATSSPYSMSGTADYSHTAEFVGVMLADDNGNKISGADYTYDIQLAPEPPGAALALAGSIGLVGLVRRRRGQ